MKTQSLQEISNKPILKDRWSITSGVVACLIVVLFHLIINYEEVEHQKEVETIYGYNHTTNILYLPLNDELSRTGPLLIGSGIR